MNRRSIRHRFRVPYHQAAPLPEENVNRRAEVREVEPVLALDLLEVVATEVFGLLLHHRGVLGERHPELTPPRRHASTDFPALVVERGTDEIAILGKPDRSLIPEVLVFRALTGNLIGVVEPFVEGLPKLGAYVGCRPG